MVKKLNFITYLSIILATLILLITIFLDSRYEKNILDKQLQKLDDTIKSEYKSRLKESVQHTISFIEAAYDDKLLQQNKNLQQPLGHLTQQNQEAFINEIRNYLYSNIFDKTRYTWINEVINYEGGENYAIRLIHPNLKKTENSFLSTNSQDIKGNKPYFEELEGVKKSGEVYFTYYFKLLNANSITEKLSYAKLYKKFNWIIATGIPLNSLNALIKIEKEKLTKEYHDHFSNMFILKFSFLLFVILIIILLRNKLAKTLLENKELNKRLKHKLKTTETSFNKFFELPLNLLIIGKIHGEILQINSGWKKILGYETEELLHRNILEFIHPNDLEKVKSDMKQLEQSEVTVFNETRIKTKNGEFKTLVWSVTSLPKEGFVYAVAQDITELKYKSNLIYQQSKMAAIGEMIANIAHQWRQPLSLIRTVATGVSLKSEMKDLNEKFLEESMEQISNATKYLSETIDDFRNFFNPNKITSQFNIQDIIKKTIKLLDAQFKNRNIKIISNVDSIEVESYENELLQVLINILNNARDQLIITDIERKLIFIDIFSKDNQLFINIYDNGGGIDESIINKVFDPYFSTKEKSMGTGIGLYMVEEIITKHMHGQINVKNHTYTYENIEYTGAQFHIVLDLDK